MCAHLVAALDFGRSYVGWIVFGLLCIEIDGHSYFWIIIKNLLFLMLIIPISLIILKPALRLFFFVFVYESFDFLLGSESILRFLV